MSFQKKFFLRTLLLTVSALLIIVLVNYKINLFGLYGNSKGESITIHASERASKYLLSYNYIPSNFEGILIGPSLSANINTKSNSSIKVYNCSILGANMSELLPIATNVIERGNLNHIFISLHPYLLKDHGMKSSSISNKTYYSALGSVGLLKIYTIGIIRKYNWWPSKYPKGQYNDYGFNYYNPSFSHIPVDQKVKDEIEGPKESLDIDSVAFLELSQLIRLCEKNNVQITAYFHPLPRPIYQHYKTEMNHFKTELMTLFKSDHLVIDYNTPFFEDFTTDFSNYIDHGHLSLQGQEFLFNDLVERTKLQTPNL